MHCEEEVSYRNRILLRARNGEKITSEERLWLATHRIINHTLGYPYLNTDIIQLQSQEDYNIRVKVENLTYPGRMIPIITVPGGNGKIVAHTLLTDYKGNKTLKKPVKMLGLLVDNKHNEAEFVYQSNLRLLEVGYECDYFDDKQHIMVRKSSSVGDPNFAMLSEVLADNKILYRCKAPTNDDFESLSFSIEWEAEKTGEGYAN